MNIKEMRGVALKKALSAKSVAFRYHNKNGGNFGINIRGLLGKDYELSGEYDKNGNFSELRFGHIYQLGCRVNPKDLEHLASIILYAVTPTITKIGDL